MTEVWEEYIQSKYKEQLERSISAGEILPRLELPEVGDEIEVLFLSEPKKITASKLPKGSAFAADVLFRGTPRNMIVPDSLLFNLLKAKKVHNIDSLVNNAFVIRAQVAPAGGKSEAKVYYALYRPSKSKEVVKTEVTEL